MQLALPVFDGKDAWITPGLSISILALFFTVLSFWWIHVRRGRLRCYTSHAYSGAFSSRPILVLSFAFHNPAPAPIAVLDLRLQLSLPEDRSIGKSAEPSVTLRWIASHSSIYPKNETREYMSAFAVDGRKIVEKFIEFQAESSGSSLNDGPYRATVEALIPSRWSKRNSHRWREVASFAFNSQLAQDDRSRLIPRSNDPDFDRVGE